MLVPALWCAAAVAQDAEPVRLPVQDAHSGQALSLPQAEELALRNHPRIAATNLRALAAAKGVTEARSAYFPMLSGYATGTIADEGTLIAAGTLQTSSLSSRTAVGMSLSQLVTDFGRTFNLTHSARALAESQKQIAADTRAQIVLEVRQAYYRVLAAEAVENAARAELESRRLSQRQISALAESQMKSTLDVNFAEVLTSEAELAVYQANSAVQESRAQLGAALGDEHDSEFALVDIPTPGASDSNIEMLISEALRERPDLQAQRLNETAAQQYAAAEKKLSYPSVNLLGSAGEIPQHDSTIHVDQYGAAGLNISVPIFNGKLYSARQGEAEYRAQAAAKDVEALRVRIARDVRVAWFETNNAYQRLDVTSRLVQQTRTALRLAQARYENGLGSIVELNEAQLSETSAEITAAGAKYEYLSRRAALDYATGAIQ